MQFTVHENVGQPTKIVTFEFFEKLKSPSRNALIQIFKRLNGRFITYIEKHEMWDFPKFVSNETIQCIIQNTCFECGGLMQDSTAFTNTLVSFDDFGGDANNRGTTQSKSGPAIQIKVRKCSNCGHSHT